MEQVRCNILVRTPVADLLSRAAVVIDQVQPMCRFDFAGLQSSCVQVISVDTEHCRYVVGQGVPSSVGMQVVVLADTKAVQCPTCSAPGELDINRSGPEDENINEAEMGRCNDTSWSFVSYANGLETILQLPKPLPTVEGGYVAFVPRNAQLANIQWSPVESGPTSFFIMN